MNDKEKLDMYNRIVSNSSNNKEQMYNRIISNYNNYKSNKTTDAFSSEPKLKFSNIMQNNRDKFKSGISNIDSIKKKRYENASALTKMQSKALSKLENKSEIDIANSILRNRKKSNESTSQNDNKNLISNIGKIATSAATAPLMFTPIGSKIRTPLLENILVNNKDSIKYASKRAGVGVLGGLNGILKAGTTEMQNNMQKGQKENKSIFDNIGDVATSTVDLFTGNKLRGMATKAVTEGVKTLTDKNSTPIQKLANMANNASSGALEMLPAKRLFDNTFKLIGNNTPEGSDKVIGNVSNTISRPYDNLKAKLYEEGQKYNAATQTAGNVAEVVGNMVPSIGASIVAGPEAGLLTTGISAKGTATEEALAKGAQLDQAVKIGDTKGMVEAGTELLAGGINFFGKGALDDIVEKGLIDKVSNNVGKFLIRQGYEFGGEVGEEIISDVIGTLIDKGTVDPNAKYSIEELGETTATTILSTAVLKALGVPVNNISDVIMNNKQKNVQSEENNTSQSIETQKEKESNISNRLEDKNSQNAILEQIRKNKQNSELSYENIANNNKNMYNNSESEGGNNEQVQLGRMLEGNTGLSGVHEENMQQDRKYTREEYNEWERKIKPLERGQLDEQKLKLIDDIKRQYDKDIVFFDGSNSSEYFAGASYNNKNRINIDAEQVKSFGLKKVIYHEVAESDILHNKELSADVIQPAIQMIIEDPNFEKQKLEFWNNQEGQMPSDYLIAKDILCDRFSELKTGENIDYKNVLSQETNMTIDFSLNNFHNNLYKNEIKQDSGLEIDENQVNLKNKAQNYINRSKSQFINDLVSDLQTSKYSNKEILNQSVDEIINEINNNDGKVSKEKADELFENLYSKLVKTDSDYYNQYKDLKENLRKTKLFVPENVANDISDFGDFRKNNRGNLILTNDSSNVNIDTKYKELSETYPELFPADITNQSDQLQKISEIVRDIKKTETNVQAYLDKNMGPDYKMWAREDFNRILDKFQKDVNMAYRYNADKPQKSNFIIAKDELTEMYKSLPQLRRNYEKVMNKEVLTERDRVQVDRLLKNEITIDELPKNVNKQGIINVFRAKQPLNVIQESIKENKRNIRELRMEQAQKDLGDLSKWKDKKMGWLYSRETASRNIYDIAPKEIAKKIDNDYIQEYHINEAKAVRTINQYTDEIKDLKLSTRKKYNATFSMQEMFEDKGLEDVVKTRKVSEAELVQIFGEGRITLDQLQETGVDTQKIIKSVETFRNIYDKLFDDVNEVLLKNGLEPVQKRANYFPHFSEAEPDNLLSKAAKLAGIDLSGELLPTDIAGKTQNFKPNKKFVGNFLQRSTDITDFNALKGFDRYIQGVTDVIYHTEDIMKFRALSDSIRSFYSTKEIKAKIQNIEESTELTPEEKNEKINEIKEQTVDKSNLSNFVTWLDNYINILAGKKSINDRGAEKELSRKVYKAMNKVESRIGANMVAGNIGVSFTNLAPLAQASAECSVPNLVKGLYGSMIANGKALIGKRDTSFASESDFITRRRGTETTTTSFLNKVTKPLDIITSSIDDVISEGIVRARYIQNLKNGMTQQEALHEADTYSAGLMADRSKGAMPTQFYSTNPLAKMVNMFQVEVNNQYSYMFKDMKRNIENKTNTKVGMTAQMTKSYAKLLIASYMMNELISNVRGNATRVLPDPIYIVKELIKGLGNDDKDDDWETINGMNKELLGNTPFVSVPLALFGNAFGLDSENIGRVSIAGAIPDVSKVGSTLMSDADSEYKKETLKKEAEKPLYNLIFPKAGSQVKKTVQGAEAVVKGGSYSTAKSGEKKLQFNVDKNKGSDVAKALIFGKWSTSGAQNYDNKPLTEKQQQEMKDLNVSFTEYKKYQSDLSEINKIQADKDSKGKSVSGTANAKKAYQIMNSDKYSDDEKNYLIKKLYSEDSKYKISANQLKKIDNSEESYKYFFGLSSEKQKEFFSDMKEYNFNSKKLIDYYKSTDKIDDKYDKEIKNIKAKGYNSDIEKEMVSEVNQKKKTEIAENLISSKYSDKQKLYLYSKSYKTNDVEMAQKLNINANSFIKFDSKQFESDYSANGKTIKNSKLNKVVSYVEGLPNLTVAQKALLIKSEMSSYDKYNNQIIEYVDSQNLSTKEKEEILKNVGFKIKNGRVYD